MEYAVVKTDIAPIFEAPGTSKPRLDEMLLGMTAKVLEREDEWCRVESEWGFVGFLATQNLVFGQAEATVWGHYGKMAARAPYVDILAVPSAEGAIVASLPKGGLLHPTGPQDESGYLPVALPDGTVGYARGGNLMPQLSGHVKQAEKDAREAIASTALSYLGVQHRRGGRSPLGIDDTGLVLMAYRLNGVALSRGLQPNRDGPLYTVKQEDLGMGDVLLFEGHMGIYLGEGSFVHATNKTGSDGVVVNSLLPASPFYRQDLACTVKACGSLFAG